MDKSRVQTARASVVRRTATAAQSPGESAREVRTSKYPFSVSGYVACGAVITDEVKALQCDRRHSEWKCASCLNVPTDIYDHLVSDPHCELRWYCNNCDSQMLQ